MKTMDTERSSASTGALETHDLLLLADHGGDFAPAELAFRAAAELSQPVAVLVGVEYADE